LLPTIAPLDLPQVVVVEIDPSGVADSPYERFLAAGSPEPVQSWLQDEEEPISINYTSGTTDRPKGVLYSHRGAYLNAPGEVVEAGLRSDGLSSASGYGRWWLARPLHRPTYLATPPSSRLTRPGVARDDRGWSHENSEARFSRLSLTTCK
jgi:acyl-CoA synthetase (AMP-forming)/AMP-acid ligase II